MRPFLTPLFLLPFALSAQTTWVVTVGGSTAPGSDSLPYYEPDTFVVALGDEVLFNCVSGKHNVYASLDMFPDNPEEFWSNTSTQFSPWTFTHTFTIPGVYEFMCTGIDHSDTQSGRITVLGGSGIAPAAPTPSPYFSLFPVPANDRMMISIRGCRGAQRALVLNAGGQQVRAQAVKDNSTEPVDLSGLPVGQYFMMVEGLFGRTSMKPFVKL